MAIKIKALERNISFQKGKEKYAYVLQTDLYSQLTQAKVSTKPPCAAASAGAPSTPPGTPSARSYSGNRWSQTCGQQTPVVSNVPADDNELMW